jgi:signal peptidase I
MRPARVRSRLLSATCLVLVGLAWIYLAPSQIGGSTQYVVTDGISMRPAFHTGDLALVRPAAQYRVGDVVAYHSTLLRVVVLHRIIGHTGDHYIFKGDNNNFVDPIPPVRSQLVGKLWLHIPNGGLVLHWLHTPLVAALIVVVFGLLVLLTAGEGRRRRRRRQRRANSPGTQGPPPMTTTQNRLRSPGNLTGILTVSAIAALLFVVLGAIAFSRPLDRQSTARTPYTQQVRFSYHASAPAGAVYPTGIVATGDPIFLQLVHRVRFNVDYGLTTTASHQLGGTEQVFLTITGPTGWSRSMPLGPLRRFGGVAARTQVTVDLPSVQSLINRVQQLTGVPAAAGYTLAVAPQVHIRGELAGQAIDTSFAPTLSFQLSSLQLQPAGLSSPAAGSSVRAAFAPSRPGTVATSTRSPNSLAMLGHALPVAALRLAAVIAFLLCAGLTVFAAVARRLTPSDEATRIQAEYPHLIVPVVLGPDGLGGAPVDVPTIAALARLAQSGQRLILHSRDNSRDTYLVNDEGTIYRYRADPGNVVWGEWSATPRPLANVAASALAHASQPAFATAVTPAPEPRASTPQPPEVVTSAPEVFPPPAFMFAAPAQAPSETPPPVPEATPRPSAPEARFAPPPSAQPAVSPKLVTRPRLRSWMKSQGDRARVVRELGSAILGSGGR